MSSPTAQLPPPGVEQAFCDVSALEAGRLDMPAERFVTTAAKGEKHIVPSLAFLIQHRPSGTRLLFDLGIRHDIYDFPQMNRYAISAAVESDDVCISLEKGDLGPEDIPYVILSHCHWDHIGDTRLFPRSKFLVGSECRSLFEPGYPADPSSVFFSGTLPEDRIDYLDVHTDAWKPIGPFPRALDFFADGSMYLVDAPGHLQGHLNLLVRTSPDGGWLLLAGDAAHDWRLVRGQGEIAMYTDVEGVFTCIHQSKKEAEETIRRIAEATKLPRVRVLLAHDGEWFDNLENRSFIFPGKIASL
jgi:glyoxylase-like metal-dependent hydrolase (beta-lactamase superfamily II)